MKRLAFGLTVAFLLAFTVTFGQGLAGQGAFHPKSVAACGWYVAAAGSQAQDNFHDYSLQRDSYVLFQMFVWRNSCNGNTNGVENIWSPPGSVASDLFFTVYEECDSSRGIVWSSSIQGHTYNSSSSHLGGYVYACPPAYTFWADVIASGDTWAKNSSWSPSTNYAYVSAVL